MRRNGAAPAPFEIGAVTPSEYPHSTSATVPAQENAGKLVCVGTMLAVGVPQNGQVMETVTVFTLGERRLGLSLCSVERVLRAVAVTPLPNAPTVVRGVIDVHGEIIPVVDLHVRFGLPARDIALDDHLLIARTRMRKVALLVEQIAGVVELDAGDIVATESVAPGTEHFRAVARLPDGIVLIQDLDAFLSLDEERVLDDALAADA
jgi:purine-binding chemotaxis protein CheW